MGFKRISDAELVQVSEETNLLVEVNGEIKRTASTEHMKVEKLKNLITKFGGNSEDVQSVDEALDRLCACEIGGGVSSWNDLTDKPFGEELNCIFDETLEFAYDAPIGGYTSYLEEPLDVHDKDEVIVEWDGKQYECVAGSPFPGVLLVGNASVMGAQDTGEPFLYLFTTNEYDETQIAFYTPSNATPNTHSVKVYTNTVKTIDEKFLPKIPSAFQVNVSYDEENDKWVSDKTYEEITTAEEMRTPIVGTFTDKDGRVFTMIGCDISVSCHYFCAFDVSNQVDKPRIYKIEIEDGSNYVYVHAFELTVSMVEL